MGGICGLIGLEPRVFEDSVLDLMIARMPHRGKQVRRLRRTGLWLASIDHDAPEIWPPPGREMPTDAFVVLDGAIENLRDLSTELLREGYQAPAQAAAILAAGFKAHGPAFLSRLQGSYAAVVQDPEAETTWLARDPLGKRPLYIHRTRSRMIFASEIRALLADPSVRLELDPEQLRVLLTLGFNPAPNTVLKGVHKIPPGHLIQIERAGLKVLRHDEAGRDGEIEIEFEDAVQSYRHALGRAVRRCGSEEKPGIFLSGGTDSSALVYLQTHDGGTAETFTATFTNHEEAEDERIPAWQAARALGTLHREREIEFDDMASHFLAVARVVEEPVAAAWGIPFLRLAEAAEQHVGVVWTGQGAGALHGEGGRWRWLQWSEWVSGLPDSVSGIVTGVARRLGGRTPVYSGTKLLAVREERERIVSSFFLFEDAALDRLLRSGHIGDREIVRKLLDRWREPVSERDPLAQGLFIHGRTFLPDAVFAPAERMASELGLAIRFPLADTEVVHWLERLPAAYRLDGTHGKRLHREALSAWLPAGVLARSKRSFGEAAEHWLRGPGAPRVADWLLGPTAWLPSVLDGAQVRAVIDDAGRRGTPAAPLLLLVQLELWAREIFLGGGR